MAKSAIAIGITCILIGAYCTYNVIITPETPNWLIIHLSVLIGIGIGLIVLNKEESKVEQRKDIKKNNPLIN